MAWDAKGNDYICNSLLGVPNFPTKTCFSHHSSEHESLYTRHCLLGLWLCQAQEEWGKPSRKAFSRMVRSGRKGGWEKTHPEREKWSLSWFPQLSKLIPLLRSAQTLPELNPWEQHKLIVHAQSVHCIWPCLPTTKEKASQGKKLQMWMKRNTRENPSSLCYHCCSVPLPGSDGSVPQEAPGSGSRAWDTPQAAPSAWPMSSGPTL